ncbi:2',5'-phosphodiesterase 12, partial [Stegodyphus mimosarum]
MRYTFTLFRNNAFRLLFRQYSVATSNGSAVKVVSIKDDDSIKVTFKYLNSYNLIVKRPKDEGVHISLSHIKAKTELINKREEIRRGIVNKYAMTAQTVVETYLDGDTEVSLIKNNEVMNENIPNIEAWSQASMLKVGNDLYEIKYNTPTVVELSLPRHIIAGCPIRPHFILECASLDDCKFTWYRSVTQIDVSRYLNSERKHDILIDDDKYWLKVNEGFIYFTMKDDIGCYLKVVCTPKQEDRTGPDFAVESDSVVEAGPEMFPFEERHIYTKTLSDKDSLRCISYNVLANVYVEKRNFPYCSAKARHIHYRKQLLLKEILGYNSDIICLQEVQERIFEHDLAKVLRLAGFDGFYAKKGGRRFEGVATFYRTSKYRVLDNYRMLLNEIVREKEVFLNLTSKVSGNCKTMSTLLAQDTVIQAILLEDFNGRKILVANTHLYSNKDTPEVRLIQAAFCLCYIEHIIKMNVDSMPVLFCGDFNSLPASSAYDFITSGIFECCSSWKSDSVPGTDTILRHNLHLSSACGTPEYTNYTEEFCGCLDYIFYSKNHLQVTDVVPMPSHEKVTAQVGLPNEHFPSDHIALVCTLKWKT